MDKFQNRFTRAKNAGEKFLFTYQRTGRFRVAVCYPNTYYSGMSNLGFQSLFHGISLFHGLQAHRFFIERDGNLYSPDFHVHSLDGYDALFFSVAFELDYVNLLTMLNRSGIFLLREKRVEGRPMLVVGGVTVTANPLVLSPFADILYLGDMECGLQEILRAMIAYDFKRSDAFLASVGQIKGAYVPAVHGKEPVARAAVPTITDPAHTVILTQNTEFANMFLIEIGRGCRNRCNFCMTRCVNRPFRSIEERIVVDRVEMALPYTARVGLVAPVLTDHKSLSSIVRRLNGMDMRVSFSSLRADDFNRDIALLLRENGQHTVTFAPETGSEELRRRIGKELTDAALLDAVRTAREYGVRRFRYYFMIGLPEETADDIGAIGKLVRRTVQVLSQGKGQLVLSINPFVPKMGTGLETARLYPLEYYERVRALLKEDLAGIKGVRYRIESFRKLYLQFYLSVGDHKIGMLLGQCLGEGSLRGFDAAAARIMG
jgi:radical SAM superfamily enzyme YgiQ (UPF0313 family)